MGAGYRLRGGQALLPVLGRRKDRQECLSSTESSATLRMAVVMSGERHAVVLVLDDDPNVGEFVKAALPETAYRVVWRRTSEDAIRAAGEEPPDIAVVDIGLSADG